MLWASGMQAICITRGIILNRQASHLPCLMWHLVADCAPHPHVADPWNYPVGMIGLH